MGFEDNYFKMDKDIIKQMEVAYNTVAQYELPSGTYKALMEWGRAYNILCGSAIDWERTIKAGNVLEDYFRAISKTIEGINLSYTSIFPNDITLEEEKERTNAESKIITEIYTPDKKEIETNTTIILSPINDRVLKYLAENPTGLYNLSPDDFETAMAEIYKKLGYNVEKTKQTRDGGKDIILRKPTELGDFVYYVECKNYSASNPVSIGIVKSFVGTVDIDRVNGGIIATTSYFTRDAQKFINDHSLQCKIKMHDYNKIQQLLKSVV